MEELRDNSVHISSKERLAKLRAEQKAKETREKAEQKAKEKAEREAAKREEKSRQKEGKETKVLCGKVIARLGSLVVDCNSTLAEAGRVPKELKKEPKEAFGAIEVLYNTASEKIKEAVPTKLDFTLADVGNAATRAEAARATLTLTLKTMGIR